MSEPSSTWERLAGLPCRSRATRSRPRRRVRLERLRAQIRSSICTRRPGGRRRGRHLRRRRSRVLQAAGPVLPLAGSWTIESFSERIASSTLSRRRRSRRLAPLPPLAFESAALDLALRQAGRAPAALRPRAASRALRRVAAPRRAAHAGADPGADAVSVVGFKLDPTSSWDDELFAALAAPARSTRST